MHVNNNVRFCYWSKKKYFSQTLLEECKYKIKKTKLENLINDDFKLSSSDNESDNKSDHDSNKSENNESNKKFVES